MEESDQFQDTCLWCIGMTLVGLDVGGMVFQRTKQVGVFFGGEGIRSLVDGRGGRDDMTFLGLCLRAPVVTAQSFIHRTGHSSHGFSVDWERRTWERWKFPLPFLQLRGAWDFQSPEWAATWTVGSGKWPLSISLVLYHFSP